MATDHTKLTPEEARAQLSASQGRSLRSDGDRKVHAVGTAVMGLSIGLYMAAQNIATGTTGILVTAIFMGIWLAQAVWVERSARTVPRRARLWSRLGIGGSFVVALVAVLPWLNLREQTEPNTWPLVVVGGLLAAVPSLMAAAVIAGTRR